MSRFQVTKCICHDKPFEQIKDYAREHDISSLEELQEIRYCSCSCRLCAPYVEVMLETGQTEFEPGAFYKRSSGSH